MSATLETKAWDPELCVEGDVGNVIVIGKVEVDLDGFGAIHAQVHIGNIFANSVVDFVRNDLAKSGWCWSVDASDLIAKIDNKFSKPSSRLPLQASDDWQGQAVNSLLKVGQCILQGICSFA